MSLVLIMIFMPILMGFCVYFIGKKNELLRDSISVLVSIIELILAIVLVVKYKDTQFSIDYVFGIGLSFKADGFRCLYSIVSIFLWFITLLFSHEYMRNYNDKNRYYMFYLWTLGSVIGVFLSNNLFTTFVFFEMMSFVSYVLVMHDEKDLTKKAGNIYLTVSVISGMILLMGLFIIYAKLGTLDFYSIKELIKENVLSKEIYAGGICLLLGFGAKAGMYPLHIWLPKAHPVAPAPASALLSGILTKTGVFGIIVIAENIFFDIYSFAIILLILAVITMFLGAVLALFSINIKRTIALSSMSQIGFILTAIAMISFDSSESLFAAHGAILHMVNHSLIKLVLFIIAGVVVMNIHKLDLNDIKGFGRGKYVLMFAFLICGLSLGGVPGFSGYISKTLIHESILEVINLLPQYYGLLKTAEILFILTGGFTLAYITKLFVCLFIEKNNDDARQVEYDNLNKNYLSIKSKVAIILTSLIVFIMGIIPNFTMNNIARFSSDFFYNAEKVLDINYFNFENIKGALISISVGLLTYFIFVRKVLMKKDANKSIYINLWPDKLNLIDIVYIPIYKLIKAIMFYVFMPIAMATDSIIYFIGTKVLKGHYYKFEEKTISYKIGEIIDKYNKKYAKVDTDKKEEFDNITKLVKNYYSKFTNSFSYSLLIFCLGLSIIVVILLFV